MTKGVYLEMLRDKKYKKIQRVRECYSNNTEIIVRFKACSCEEDDEYRNNQRIDYGINDIAINGEKTWSKSSVEAKKESLVLRSVRLREKNEEIVMAGKGLSRKFFKKEDLDTWRQPRNDKKTFQKKPR
ncbi:hypothetical protein Tco_1220331 [Tanacetum coccineum]